MESTKKFELTDDVLDEVAGGASNRTAGIQVGDIFYYQLSPRCPECNQDFSSAVPPKPAVTITGVSPAWESPYIQYTTQCCNKYIKAYNWENLLRKE